MMIPQGLRDRLSKLRGGPLTPQRLAASVALGLFVGATPLIGFHTPIVIALAVMLRLDALVAVLVSNIYVPPVLPFLFVGETQLGAILLQGRWLSLSPADLHIDHALQLSSSLALGSLLFGITIASVGALIAFFSGHRWLNRVAPEAAPSSED